MLAERGRWNGKKMLILDVMLRSWAFQKFFFTALKKTDADTRCNAAQLGIQMMQVCMERRSRTGGLDR
jgi:hypothetical protein